jgi:ribosomal protein L24
MNSFKNKSKNDIAKDIINSFKEGSKTSVINISNEKRKIIVRRILQHIKKTNYLVLLEQKKVETQEWEIAFADVTLIKKEYSKSDNEDDYKYIGFDIHFNLIQGMIYKTIFINFSYHALLRIIERCDIKELSTPLKVKTYLCSMIKPILLRCLSMYEEMIKERIRDQRKSLTGTNKVFEKRESYIIANKLFLPIVMEIGKNIFGKPSYSFTIKTVMPDTYNSAKRTIINKDQEDLKESIFDYSNILAPYSMKM